MRASVRRLLVATTAGGLLMAGVLTASAEIPNNIPYKAVAWTGNVYLPPTVHYTADKTIQKISSQPTIYQDDYSLPMGVDKIVKLGSLGYQRDTYRSWYVNSHVITTKHVARKVVKPVARIVSVGKYVQPPPPPPAPAPVSASPVPSPTDNAPVPVSGSGPSTNQPAPPPAVYGSGDPRSIARSLVSPNQWSCLDLLWSHESGWSVTAENASSGAYGIPQALPGSKMASAGADWQTNAATQIRWGLGYIAGVYGTPCGAWAHELAVNWY